MCDGDWGARQGWLRLIGATGDTTDGTVANLADLFAFYRSISPIRDTA